ncbi:MFS transporter [Streptomyces sp. CBMA156]|uniref:MFS transporter n=2 Tax=Streptomyces sp. CBMA156 TaxID=1930280 RepID=UPI001DA832AC|nr:MFS transporter [Streptomyces sp. CBMA156]MBD0675625.1 arabinose ABC transporter permease [Streptomyces sp. CBMA156]
MPRTAPARNALAVPVLALGVFGIITTEMGVVGVLPSLAERLDVSTGTAGTLVGAFALTVAATGPAGVLLASRLRRKTVLATALAVFAVANAVYALSDSFPLVLAFRILPALFHPVFFALALTAATRLAPPGREARAATTVFAGVSAGFAFGVPLTSYVADHLTVPAAFWTAAAVNLAACAGLLAFFPDLPETGRPTYAGQLGILRQGRLWLAVAAVTLLFAAMFSGYGYIAEYLENVTGLDASLTGPALMAFGVVMTAGNLVFGRLLERGLVRTVTAYPVLYLALYLLLDAVGPHTAPMLAAVLVWGAVHSGGLAVAQAWLARDATDAPEFGNSLFISFSNLGITLGTTLGGAIVTTAGPRHLPLAGAALAAAALAAVLLRRRLPQPGRPGRTDQAGPAEQTEQTEQAGQAQSAPAP